MEKRGERARWIGVLLLAGSLGLGSAPARADVDAGQAVFSANCAACHGANGDGSGPAAAAMVPKPRDLTRGEFAIDTDGDGVKGSDADLGNVIRKGAAAFGGSPLMSPWGHLSEAEVGDLVAFIRSLAE